MHTPSLVLAVCLPLLPSDPPQPGDYNWGSGITALEHAVVDFWISATITTHQPQSHTSANGPFGYTVTQGPAEGGPDEVLFKVDCGDEDPPKEYSVPMFGFLAPPGPNGATNNYARAAYNEDGEPAIGFSIDALWPQSDTFLWGLYGADPFSSEYYVAFDAWVLSALFPEIAHIHQRQSAADEGEEACQQLLDAEDADAGNTCSEAYANSYTSSRLCDEAKNGTMAEGLPWSDTYKSFLKLLADAQNAQCEINKDKCQDLETEVGCSMSGPSCSPVEGCPGECDLD